MDVLIFGWPSCSPIETSRRNCRLIYFRNGRVEKEKKSIFEVLKLILKT
jgi:hypothetical protein